MCEHSLRKTRRHIKKATKQQQTNKIQKQRSATHCDVRHGTSCCDVRRAGGSRGSSFSGDSYKSIAFCNIRGGGRGSGGVILYEKKIATVAGSYRGISATFCKEHCNVSETYRPRSPSRILQKQTFLPKTHS